MYKLTKAEELKQKQLLNKSLIIVQTRVIELPGMVQFRVVLQKVDGLYMPYVTHCMDAKTKEKHWGHYFKNMSDAFADFMKRAEQYAN